MTQFCSLARFFGHTCTIIFLTFRFGEKGIDADMFGTRYDYLDRLPPFSTSSSLTAKEMVLDAESPDFWCQNTLLKLQSLLCCTAMDTTGSRATVLAFLDLYPDVVGSVSLRVLSSSPADALPPLCLSHPEAVLAYAKQQGQPASSSSMGVAEWQLLLSCLQNHLTASEEASLSHPMHEAWYSAMQEVAYSLFVQIRCHCHCPQLWLSLRFSTTWHRPSIWRPFSRSFPGAERGLRTSRATFKCAGRTNRRLTSRHLSWTPGTSCCQRSPCNCNLSQTFIRYSFSS